VVRARATAPVDPLTGETVIVELPTSPARTETLAGLALMLKSCTVNVTIPEWDNWPLVPVTVTEYVPERPEQERTET